MIQDLQSFRVPSTFRGRSVFVVQLWWLVQATLFAHSPKFMYGWRRALLRAFGAQVGEGALIRPSVVVTYPWKVKIGKNTWVGDECTIYSLGEIEIGDNTAIAHKVYLCSAGHDYTKPTFDIYEDKITVGSEVWIANDVFVAPGVTIGHGAVIGARSSVFQDMPAGMVCYGLPAKPMRVRGSKAEN